MDENKKDFTHHYATTNCPTTTEDRSIKEAEVFNALAEQFPFEDILWRVQNATVNSKGRPSVSVVPYIDVRKARERLSEVLGPGNWENKFYSVGEARVCCEITIRIGDMWYSRSDGAGDTKVEGVKGAFSDAFKRAAAAFGVAEYLYDIPKRILFGRTIYAEICDKGDSERYGDTKVKGGDESNYVNWKPPRVPEWGDNRGSNPPDIRVSNGETKKKREEGEADVKGKAIYAAFYNKFHSFIPDAIKGATGKLLEEEHDDIFWKDAMNRLRSRVAEKVGYVLDGMFTDKLLTKVELDGNKELLRRGATDQTLSLITSIITKLGGEA